MIQIILPKRLYPVHQKGENHGDSFKDINELHEYDMKANRFKKRIKL